MNQGPQQNSLKAQMHNILEEARMVLPGLQALFGFQTVVVFNQRFHELGTATQSVHITALLLVVMAIAMVMMPAAWHRIVEPHQVSKTTVSIASRMVCCALLPLAVALPLDIYVVLMLVSHSGLISIFCATFIFFLLFGLWFVIPSWRRLVKNP